MPDTPNRVAIERVNWLEVLPVLRFASAFRYALQPGKLIVALLAVLAVHLSGTVLDLIWGDVVETDLQPQGVYESLVQLQGLQAEALFDAALDLNVGLGEETGMADALYAIFVDTPRWAFGEHPWFMALFSAVVLLVFALAGGVVCRMAATQVCSGKTSGLKNAAKFVARRWGWYLLSPLIPLGFILLLGAVLMLAGLVFFNVPVLDVIGSLLYALMLLLGFLIALVGAALVFALVLMPPAMSVEGTDSFDAIARAFNYVLYKPWQLAGYLVGAVVYAAAVYMVVSALAGLTIGATQGFVGVGAFVGADQSSSEAIVSAETTRYDVITGTTDPVDPGGMEATSAWIVGVWADLLGALVLALMFSVVCCLQTQVYVLMRRSADHTPLDECAQDDESDPWSRPEDMVDPTAQAIAAAGPQGHPEPEATPSTNPSASDTTLADPDADDAT